MSISLPYGTTLMVVHPGNCRCSLGRTVLVMIPRLGSVTPERVAVSQRDCIPSHLSGVPNFSHGMRLSLAFSVKDDGLERSNVPLLPFLSCLLKNFLHFSYILRWSKEVRRSFWLFSFVFFFLSFIFWWLRRFFGVSGSFDRRRASVNPTVLRRWKPRPL